MGYLELAQPVKVLNDPQMRIPRPKPMVLIIGTTAMFPVDTKHRKNGLLPIQQMHFYVKLVFLSNVNFCPNSTSECALHPRAVFP